MNALKISTASPASASYVLFQQHPAVVVMQVQTKWRFSCILDLPWKPRLAAAGGTTHLIDGGRVVKHIEAWDVEPSRVVAQLLTPAAKVNSSTQTEQSSRVSMCSEHSCWLNHN